MNYATAPRGELVSLIFHQQQEIAILKGVVAELQEKLQQKDPHDDTSGKSIPGFVKTKIKKIKKLKAKKKRVHGFARKRENPTDKKLKRWIRKIHTVYEEAKMYPGPDPNQKLGLKEQERIQKEYYFKQKLKSLCAPLH